MSAERARAGGPAGAVHPVVLARRIQDWSQLAALALIPLALGLAIAVAVPRKDVPTVLGLIVGGICVIALAANSRLEVSLLVLIVYLTCIRGPLKLAIVTGNVGSALQDILLLAIVVGALVRLVMRKEKVRLPALGGWIVAFMLVVLVEVFNPKTQGALKSIAGIRQQLEWVPFFFFGYAVMQKKERFQQVFILLGVVTLLNGIAATYQTQLSPAQIAQWGSGYEQKVLGPDSRKYSSEGEGHVRPFGLGGDAGTSGGLAVITLPGTLALMVIMRRRKWIAVALTLGALVAAAVSLGRLQVGGTVLSAAAFAGLATIAGRRIGRPLAALLTIIVIALPLGFLFVEAVGGGIFSRYKSIAPESAVNTAAEYKSREITQVPHEVSVAPFGFGLGTAGAASSFGGHATELLEGHNVNAETQANLLVKELGLPGLIVWYAFLLRLLLLAVQKLKYVEDPDIQVSLIAIFAPLVAILFMSYDGPVSSSNSLGSWLWFAGGVSGYWLLGPGRAKIRRSRAPIGLPAAVTPV